MGAGRRCDKRYTDGGRRSLEQLEVCDGICTPISPVGDADAEGRWFETLVEVGWNVDLYNML